MLYIHIITNVTEGKYIGDKNQALAIEKAIRTSLNQDLNRIDSTSLIYDVSEIDNLKDALEKQESEQKTHPHTHLVIGIGDHGIDAFKQLEHHANKENMILTWAGHQLFAELESIKHFVDVIALPNHVAPDFKIHNEHDLENAQKRQLVPTNGVAHCVNAETLNEELAKWEKLIPKAEGYIGVFLGGDAPCADKDKTMKYFTAEEARLLALEVADIAKQTNATVLLTNGPRTGKHNPRTKQEIPNCHRDNTIDATTKAFINVLNEQDVDYDFTNFVYGQPSAYKPYLATLVNNNGYAVVTGDSTSMVTEITDNLPNNNVFAAVVGSMNETHHTHIDCCFRLGRLNRMTIAQELNQCIIQQQIETEASEEKPFEQMNAADQIAIALKPVLDLLLEIKPKMLTVYNTAKELLSKFGNSDEAIQQIFKATSGDYPLAKEKIKFN